MDQVAQSITSAESPLQLLLLASTTARNILRLRNANFNHKQKLVDMDGQAVKNSLGKWERKAMTSRYTWAK